MERKKTYRRIDVLEVFEHYNKPHLIKWLIAQDKQFFSCVKIVHSAQQCKHDAFNVFCLVLGLELSDLGLKQGEVARFLVANRTWLRPVFECHESYHRTFLVIDTVQDSMDGEPPPRAKVYNDGIPARVIAEMRRAIIVDAAAVALDVRTRLDAFERG